MPAPSTEDMNGTLVPTRHRPDDPEYNIRAALLRDGIHLVTKYAGRPERTSQELVAETCDWFADADTAWPFSLVNICDAIGLDIQAVRASVYGQVAQRSIEQAGWVYHGAPAALRVDKVALRAEYGNDWRRLSTP